MGLMSTKGTNYFFNLEMSDVIKKDIKMEKKEHISRA